MELRRRWKLLHGMVHYEAEKKELEKLRYWLKTINLESHANLNGGQVHNYYEQEQRPIRERGRISVAEKMNMLCEQKLKRLS